MAFLMVGGHVTSDQVIQSEYPVLWREGGSSLLYYNLNYLQVLKYPKVFATDDVVGYCLE